MCSDTHTCIHGRGESYVVNNDNFYMVSLLWFIGSPFKFLFVILTLVKALVGGDGKREIHEDEVFRNEVSPLLKEGPREPASLSQQVRTQLKVVPMKKKSRHSPDPAFIRTAI